ncbi:DedA family protein [soil metagenome]
MLEIFHHLLPPDFDWLFANYSDTIYSLLFAIIFIETGLVIMPFLPGDSLLFLAGLFARTGQLNLTTVILLLWLAAVLGDNMNYWIGRKIGLKVFTLKVGNRFLVKQEYLDKTHLFFEKHGSKAIILARFVPFVRTFAPFAAGVGKMDYKKYIVFDILGGFLWVAGLSTAGYLLGNIEFIKKHVDLVCIGIVLVSVLPILFQFLKTKFGKTE